MTLSLNCKDAGDPICTHTMYGETEKNLLPMQSTEDKWNEDIGKMLINFGSKSSSHKSVIKARFASIFLVAYRYSMLVHLLS
jgi:hypothetical protein